MFYIIKWAIALTALYSLYGLFLRRETFHKLNRGVLVGILLVSMVLPFCQLNNHNTLSTALQQIETRISEASSEVTMMNGEMTATGIGEALESGFTSADSASAPAWWYVVLVTVYLAGLTCFWLRYAKGFASLFHLIRRGTRTKGDDIPANVHLILNDKVAVPCSWMKWILVNRKDLHNNREMILRHELAHIRRHHSLDMLLCDFTAHMLWFLPFAHMLRKDLRNVHEYQADRAVLQTNVDEERYQMLLIQKASLRSSSAVANSLNASEVKRRLQMMLQRRSSRLAQLKVLYLLPLSAITLMAFARPNIMEEVRETLVKEEVKAERVIEETVAPIIAPLSKVDNLAETSAEPTAETDLEATVADSNILDNQENTETTDQADDNHPLSDEELIQKKEAERAQRAEERRKARLKGPLADDGLPIFYDLPLNSRRDILYDGVWMERRDSECLLHIVHTFEKDDEIYYLAGEDSYIQDQDNPSVLYKCRGTSIARAFDTQFHVCGMRGKSVDLTIIFPPLPESYRYIHLIGVGFKSRGVFSRYELEPEKSTPRR